MQSGQVPWKNSSRKSNLESNGSVEFIPEPFRSDALARAISRHGREGCGSGDVTSDSLTTKSIAKASAAVCPLPHTSSLFASAASYPHFAKYIIATFPRIRAGAALRRRSTSRALNDVSNPSIAAVAVSIFVLIELCIIRRPFEALVAVKAFDRVLDTKTAFPGCSVRRERAGRAGEGFRKVAG